MKIKAKINSVCFICEWNEGRSPHLELCTRIILNAKGNEIRISSAGLTQGGRINSTRRDYLWKKGIPFEDIQSHKSNVIGPEHVNSDLILVTELYMKKKVLRLYPNLSKKVMTVMGFIKGQIPKNEKISENDALIEDAGGHNRRDKLELYVKLDKIAEKVAERLLNPIENVP